MEAIEHSVGRHGVNHPQDAKIVQKLLNIQKIPGVIVPLSVDGKVGPRTIARIEIFQKLVVRIARPDGLVEPNKTTLNWLQKGAAKPSAKLPSTLRVSSKAIDLLKSIEQLSPKPYDDQTGKEISGWVKGATIGYGHLIAENEWSKYKDGITADKALALFKSDLAPYAATVNSKTIGNIKQNEFDALVLFAFNIGRIAFANSSVLKIVNDPDAKTSHKDLETAWKAWNRSQGKINKGLVNRRQCEWGIYSKGVYKQW